MSTLKRDLKIALLLGGPGAEREVSLVSGKSVYGALRQAGFTDVTEVDVHGPDFRLPEGTELAYNIIHGTFGEDGALQAILEERGIEVTPVIISVDPRRDTPEVLKTFVETMHERMIGLTGTPAEIDAVSKSWRNFYRLNDQDDPENYLVDHMTNTYLVMPGAGTVEFFARDIPPQEMADRTACFINAAS